MTDITKFTYKTIQNYRLAKYLGYTGVAHVYTAINFEDNKVVAVHFLPNHHLDEPNFMESYILKVAQLQQLNHPNVVSVLDFGVELGYPYLVMPNIVGPTLQDLLSAVHKRAQRIPLDPGLFICNSLVSALAHAHNHGIPHGNLKTNTVLLEQSGIVMVTDFGLPHLIEFEDPFSSILDETINASKRNHQAEKRRDLFDLGLIFYEIVTGRPPYQSPDTVLLKGRAENTPLIKPTQIYPDIPEGLEEVILNSISPEIDHRYKNINQLREDLGKFSRQVQTTVLPSARLSDVAQFSSRFARAIVPEEVETEKAKKVAIYFLDTGQVLELENNREYTLGRSYEGTPVVPDIDLTPFKAYEWGISRMHASLQTSSQEVVVIKDLGSSNGTWHAGERLEADQPHTLHHGDIIMLGKLRLQILLPAVGQAED